MRTSATAKPATAKPQATATAKPAATKASAKPAAKAPAKAPAKPAAQKKAPPAKPASKPAPKATAQSKNESKQAVKAIRDAAKAADTEIDAAALALVPLWYDAFPHHRVNPLGRTTLDLMPDEINLLLARDSADFCFPVCNPKTSNYGWRWQRGRKFQT